MVFSKYFQDERDQLPQQLADEELLNIQKEAAPWAFDKGNFIEAKQKDTF
jgi:hypothetical protein